MREENYSVVPMKSEKNFHLVLEDGFLKIVDCNLQKTICEFSLDELAEIMEFRYATHWNKSKDILEKLSYILQDIKDAYENSEDVFVKKEDIVKQVKFRVHHTREE
jgi:hypothetical protein